MLKHIRHYNTDTYDYSQCNRINIIGPCLLSHDICNPIEYNALPVSITHNSLCNIMPFTNSTRLDTRQMANKAYSGTNRQDRPCHTPPDGLGGGCNIPLPKPCQINKQDSSYRIIDLVNEHLAELGRSYFL